MAGPACLHTLVNFGQNVPVLDKGGLRPFEHPVGYLLVVRVRIAMLEPEIPRVVSIDGCHEIIGDVQERVVWQVVVVAAGSGTGVDRHIDRG